LRRTAQAYPAAHQNRRFAQSPTDALIDLKVRCRLRRQIPVCWLDLRPVIHLRITVSPQRWPACRSDARWLYIHPDVINLNPAVTLPL
jgi:hypothetical protein